MKEFFFECRFNDQVKTIKISFDYMFAILYNDRWSSNFFVGQSAHIIIAGSCNGIWYREENGKQQLLFRYGERDKDVLDGKWLDQSEDILYFINSQNVDQELEPISLKMLYVAIIDNVNNKFRTTIGSFIGVGIRIDDLYYNYKYLV